MRRVYLAILTMAVVAIPIFCQAPAGARPSFEVATIKPSDSLQRGSMIQNQPGGRLVVAHVPLRAMMTFAYRIPQGGSAGPGGPEAAPPIDPNGPSIFTAIQEQLGLKLEAIKGPVDVIVIDSVQKPSEN